MDWDDTLQRVCLRVPVPLFATTTPAGRRVNCPVVPLPPGGQPDTHCPDGEPGGGQRLRWARCPNDDRLHLLPLAEVPRAAAGDHARALCGQRVLAEGLIITNSLSLALCMTCVTDMRNPNPSGSIAP